MLKPLLAAALLVCCACRQDRDLSQYTVEDPKSSLTSVIEAGNPRHASQLIAGFYQIEEGRWRWASNKMQVELRPPFASQKLGAKLGLYGNLPDIVVGRIGSISIRARLNGLELPAQTFAKPGDFYYLVEVPPTALATEKILVEFTTDKALPPNTFPNDGRELALIVSSISLETKK